MTTLLIDAVIVLWLLLFGGLAFLPLITGTTSARHHRPHPVVEDRVISIRPARPLDPDELADRPAAAIPDTGHHDRHAA